MSSRPLSDRHHLPPIADNRFEVRVLERSAERWRTLACCAEAHDARLVAAALVSTPDIDYAEVWGTTGSGTERYGVIDRFPAPTREERQQMWRDAVDQNYAGAYIDLPR
jgi:hypothetical protein